MIFPSFHEFHEFPIISPYFSTTHTHTHRSLNHPNIVGFRGTKTLAENQVILAMETCDTSLGDLIEQRSELAAGPLEPTKLRKLSMDICNALDYLHTSAFILHGDIKSYNVLIKNSFEHCKLCDFGVSLPLNDDGFVDVEKNPEAQYIGTELYTAPEVFSSPSHDISSKCDIFSFGLVIFECLTLRVPHYEHFDAINTDMLKGNASYQSIGRISQQRQAKQRLFDESLTDSKENISSIADSKENISAITLNESQQTENSIFFKSTAATIGDDTILDITGTTVNGTINCDMNVSAMSDDSMRQPMRDVSTSLNTSAMDADSDLSMMDKSELSFNCSMDAIEACYGTRPLIPDAHNFSDEYNVYLETFFMCTHAEPDERPAAGDLLKSFHAIQPQY